MIETPVARADLHAHSRFSDRPSEWFLRRIGAPESFVDPADLYRTCRERGMDFVTVTDHNTLDGSLAIADLPGVLLSAEVTTYFPDDGGKVHCLVWGVTEEEFREIDAARPNIFDLREVLRRRGTAHAIAHPLFRVNDRLSVDHVEKLILLFDRFEGLNGSRDARAGALARAVFEHLTPADIERMAEHHGIQPLGDRPWRKALTGGSDDHSGLYLADAHTVTPAAATTGEFLAHLRAGRHEPAGRSGTSLRLARSLYQIAGDYYRHRFLGQKGGSGVLGAMLARLVEGPGGDPAAPAEARSLWRRAANRVVRRVRLRRLPPAERELYDAIADWLDGAPPPAGEALPPDRRLFLRVARLAQHLTVAFGARLIEKARGGKLIEAAEALGSLGPVAVGVLPYLTAFVAQHKDEAFLQAVASRFRGAEAHRRRSGKKAWITDTFDEVNGVARTIHILAPLAVRSGRDVSVLTCLASTRTTDFPMRNFEPVGSFSLPEYPHQPFVVPPFLEVLAHIEEERFCDVVISTPGPMGLCGLAAARLLGLRCVGIYHTDFPDYVRMWTDDDQMKDLTWRYMRWFYGDMDRVYVPSRCYLDQLVAQGFDRGRLEVMPRGIDRTLFHPGRRDPEFWRAFGSNGGFKLIYVGRLAKEKNLDILADAFQEFRRTNPSAVLAMIGDGPEAAALRERYGQAAGIVFTGVLHGERLAAAYASADVLVFPSRTDTFGNVVLEAHASGLPAIVSDRGGPPEIVSAHGSGLIVNGTDRSAWAEAMRRLAADAETRERLRAAALRCAAESRWELALKIFDD